jgi:hypothetical protein
MEVMKLLQSLFREKITEDQKGAVPKVTAHRPIPHRRR